MTADELRRRALQTGSELTIGGVRFNAARAQVDAKAVPAVPAPVAPAPAAEAPSTDLLADVARMIAESERRLEEKLAKGAAAPAIPAAPKPLVASAAVAMVPTSVIPEYRKDHTIAHIQVLQRRRATPGEVVSGFTPRYRSDGAIESVTIEYERRP
jgi:hypothetical protein